MIEANINIEDVEAHFKQRREWNKLNLKEINIYRDGEIIFIDKDLIEDLEFTGLNTVDLIMYAVEEMEEG